MLLTRLSFFFFNDTATTEIYTLSLHDALPIFIASNGDNNPSNVRKIILGVIQSSLTIVLLFAGGLQMVQNASDRKSTRLNSSHANISYAVFCLKKQTTLTSDNYLLSSNISTHS